MKSAVLDRLETEGRAVARATAEYILTCFQSHDPAMLLTPVLAGPVRAIAAAAREGVQEMGDIMVSCIERRPEPVRRGDPSGPPEQ
jgi:hypothetical protein